MNFKLRTLHWFLNGFAVTYLLIVGSSVFHLYSRLQATEAMARQSRLLASAIHHLVMLSAEGSIVARTEAQWSKDIDEIKDRLTYMEKVIPAGEISRLHRLAKGADEVFRTMSTAESPEAAKIYADSLSTLVQDLSVNMRFVHEKFIVGERRQALRATFLMLSLSLALLIFLAVTASLVLRNRVLYPIEQIGDAISSYGRGHRHVRAPYGFAEEMNVLAKIFNRTADNLDAMTDSYETELAIRTSTEKLLLQRGKEISDALAEKEALLREIHHRVKNNMQVIVSLLNIHSRQTDSLLVERVFQDCRDRIDAMALIHETLYQSNDLSHIDFPAYLNKLCLNLNRAYDGAGRGVQIAVYPNPVRLNTDQCVSIGMILAELIANAFKHAFPESRSGTIEVRADLCDPNTFELSVRDDGVGIPDTFDLDATDSLGLRLVTSVIRRDLRGSIRVERTDGTHFVMQFPCPSLDPGVPP